MRITALGWTLLLVGIVGCGGKDEKADGEISKPAAATAQAESAKSTDKKEERPALVAFPAVRIPSNLEPKEVVLRFMDALRNGDDVMSEALLTDAARRATMQSDMKVQPTGSPQSDYRLGATKYLGNDKARVNSSWTEPTGPQETVTFNIIWHLRKQRNGWRIVGFSPEVQEGVFTFLDFEKPAEMMDEYQRAHIAETEGTEEGNRHARLPDMGGGTRR